MNENAANIEIVDVIEAFGLNLSGEHTQLECKEAGDKLPKSFWDTYSAFANTKGGIVLLGIREDKSSGGFEVSGVSNPTEMVKNLHDTLSNRSKVNRDVLLSDSIEIIQDISGKKVVLVYIPECPTKEKPVYLNQNQQNTYLRKGESDIKASEEELNTLLRDSAITSVDARPLKGYSLDDLDLPTLSEFKGNAAAIYPKNGYAEMPFEDFLISTGFYLRSAPDPTYYPTIGCVLLFGKYSAVKSVAPAYFLDYIDYRGTLERWADRLSSDVPNDREMNIYNFFNKVNSKLEAVDMSKFQMGDSWVRIDATLKYALREALINALAHADYFQPRGSIKIQVYDDRYVFENPGCMLVEPASFFIGGSSKARNEIIMKGFRMLNLCERQGMGGRMIFKTAVDNKLRTPAVETDLLTTELTIWKLDVADYPDLTEKEKALFRFIIDCAHPVTYSEMQKYFSWTKYSINETVKSLIQKKRIVKIGGGRSTKYMLNPSSLEMRTHMQKAALNFLKLVRQWPS